jgi:hypothetical protein
VREQRVRGRVAGRPQHGAEAPRVAQAQHALAELEVKMIVLLRRRAPRQHAQASRHAQMQDEMSVAAVHEQVLAAAADRSHRAPGERQDLARHRPAQPRLAHRHAADRAAGELRREAAPRHLDFGKLRHGESALVRGTKYT